MGGQLDRLMRLVQEMEAAAAAAQQAAATAAAAEAERMLTGRSMADSEMSGVGEDGAAAEPTPTLTPPATAGPGSGSRLPSKKQLQWADGQATPRVPGEGTGKEGGGEEDGDGGSDTDPEAAVAAAQGEKELRKGFRRRTWAGPAWLNAVSAGKVRPGLPASRLSSRLAALLTPEQARAASRLLPCFDALCGVPAPACRSR